MSGNKLLLAPTLNEIDEFFSTGQPATNHRSRAPSIISSTSTTVSPHKKKTPALIDEHGNPITIDMCRHRHQHAQPSYQQEDVHFGRGTGYVEAFKQQEQTSQALSNMTLDETATVEQLETRSMTGSTVSTMYDQMFSMPEAAKVSYTGYRYTTYNEKLPITAHRQKLVESIESTQCTIIQGMTGCGKTTQVPQYILDEYAKAGVRCKIAVTQPRRIAAISIAKRVCSERGWSEGTYCGYQVARDSKTDIDKTMITYMTTGILLQTLIQEKSLNKYTHIILDEVHERDQDTDLALLIVKKFMHTVSPTVKVILMSATFDCKIFANYFATEIRGEMEPAPVFSIDGRGYKVQETYWSDPPLNNMMALPKFEEEDPTVYPAAMTLAVKLLYEFDKMEEAEKSNGDGRPAARGTVLIFLPGLGEIHELHSLLEKDEGLKNRKLTVLPLHSSITLEEQRRVFDVAHVYYRKVILSTNIAESSITVPDIKYVIDFCLTKNLQTDSNTNMTCLRLEWASKANCKQRMGRAGRVSNGRVYRLIPKPFYVNHLHEYGSPEMTRCPLSQLILRVKKLGPEEPRYILSTALAPPDMHDIGKSILLLKEAGALANPRDRNKFNPFDGDLTFVGNVLASLPLDIQLGKLLVFGHLLGLLPECLIIAATMHTRPLFQQPFKRRVESIRHKFMWDRGLHSDPIATVTAYQEWERLKEQEYFLRAPGKESKWCQDNFLSKRTLNEVKEVIHDLTRRLEHHNIKTERSTAGPRGDSWSVADQQLMLQVTIACAFYPNYFGHEVQELKDAVKILSGKDPLHTTYMKGFPNNQGILYKRQVESMISRHVPGCKLRASFENTKCYIEFDLAAGDCGRVPRSMYVALHLALQKERLQINLYDEGQAKEVMTRISNTQKEASQARGRLSTSRMCSVKDVRPKTTSPPLQTNQPVNTSVLHMRIVHVEDCTQFWGQKVDEPMLTRLVQQHTMMNSQECLTEAQEVLNPAVGALCIAPFLGEFYRARVKAVQGDSVLVFFVDYGNTECVPAGSIRQLLDGFQTLPFQAIECALANVAPPTSSPDGGWPAQVNHVFQTMVMDKEVFCRIYSVDKGVVRLDKMIDTQSQQIEYHELLFLRNMVSSCEEGITSQQNHKMRKLTAAGVDSEDWGFGVDEHVNLSESCRTQMVTGPFSPLELRFTSYCAKGAHKLVKVEPTSLNAVALDEHPEDGCDSLMVAASLSVNAPGNKIIARETTLMPHIPGLPSLMCLLFAPSVQLRCDPNQQSYTGAICGLGMDLRTFGSAFPDHDMEIVFDREIDVDDVIAINWLRMTFNCCLAESMLDHATHTRFQGLIRDKLLALLRRGRPSREKVYFENPFRWVHMAPKDLLKHGLDNTMADQVHLFRILDAPILEDGCTSSEKERINNLRFHCQELTKLASTSANRPVTVDCELCSVRLSNVRELRIHINSNIHRSRERKLFA